MNASLRVTPADASRPTSTSSRAARRWSYDGGDIVAAAEITTRMAWAAVHAESQEVAGWATSLVPRLDLESELAFHCFLAGVWSGAHTRSRRDQRERGRAGRDLPAPLVGCLRSADPARRGANRRCERVRRARSSPTRCYGFGLVLGDDAQCDAARNVSDRAVAMADSAATVRMVRLPRVSKPR